MKNKHDGWSARRRSQRANDRMARESGYADYRSMIHARSVEELQAFLSLLSFQTSPTESKLFEVRVVAEAIGMSPKGVKWLAHTRQLTPELHSEKSRKLF